MPWGEGEAAVHRAALHRHVMRVLEGYVLRDEEERQLRHAADCLRAADAAQLASEIESAAERFVTPDGRGRPRRGSGGPSMAPSSPSSPSPSPSPFPSPFSSAVL